MNRYDLQSYALLAMARLPQGSQPRRIPLVVPRCTFDTGGGAISHLYKEIFVNRVYELAEPVPAGGRILDAGAHIGMAALYFLHTHPQARVFSIEANPATAKVLRQNLAPWQDRVEVVESALSDADGETSFFVSGGTGTNVNAGMTNREGSDAVVTEMKVTCLDVRHLFEDGGFAFAKVDIEGGEYAVLQTEHFHPDSVRSMIVE
ncbi:MAG: FkbM family methyltransferase, partial [Myxococcota bacterium]